MLWVIQWLGYGYNFWIKDRKLCTIVKGADNHFFLDENLIHGVEEKIIENRQFTITSISQHFSLNFMFTSLWNFVYKTAVSEIVCMLNMIYGTTQLKGIGQRHILLPSTQKFKEIMYTMFGNRQTNSWQYIHTYNTTFNNLQLRTKA